MSSNPRRSRPPYRSIFAPGAFDGAVVIVTGGGSGIGRCTAHELAALGARVALVGRTLAKLEQTQREIVTAGGQAVIGVADVRDEGAVTAVVERVFEEWGPIGGLVNNAGGQYLSRLEDISVNGFRAVVETNLTGTFIVSRACYRRSMRRHGGAIVNVIADIWGSMPMMGHSGAARAGALSFTETAAVEWARSGVRVNAVAPGYVASSGMDHYPKSAQAMMRGLRRTVPLGRFATESEISAAILFLLSPASAFTSGAVLRVDGARPQSRDGWGVKTASKSAQDRPAVRPFEAFGLASKPKLFDRAKRNRPGG